MPNTKSVFATGQKNLPQPNEAFVSIIPIHLVLGAVAPVVGDTIELVNLPYGVHVVDWDITSEQLDSNGAPVLALNLGILNAGKTALATVYGGGAVGNAANGNVVRNSDARCISSDASVDNRAIAIAWTVAAATWAGAAGTKKMVINLHLRA